MHQSNSNLTILEHSNYNYQPRTEENAKSADLTIAFAVDLNTAGEKLTKKVAGSKYIGIQLTKDINVLKTTRLIYAKCKELKVKTLNIAGNGIYTLVQHNWNQLEVNNIVYQVLEQLSKWITIESIRSGGQTGVDLAGLIASYKLGINTIALYPKSYRQRNEKGIDFTSTYNDIKQLITKG